MNIKFIQADVTQVAGGITFTKLMQTWDVEEYLTLSKSHFNVKVKVKVKVTVVQALRLCTGRTAHRGSRGIALPFHDHGTRRG